MKIFISEYIIMYETSYLNLSQEFDVVSMFFDYSNYYESLYYEKQRFMYSYTYFFPYEGGNNFFVRKLQRANTFFWRRQLKRRDIFFRLIPLYFIPRKWLKFYNWWGTIPNCYRFNDYGFLNDSVRYFFYNHSIGMFSRAEYQTYDCSLIFNHSHEQFDRRFIRFFERRMRRLKFVFFRMQPYRLEWLLFNLRWTNGSVPLIVLNPNCIYFGNGGYITYVRKWVYWTYHFYNRDRSRPFVVYGFWMSDFYENVFHYRVLHYRNEIFRDSIFIFKSVIGSSEDLQWHLYFLLRMFFYGLIFFWFCIFFVLGYSREKLLRLILLDEHMPNFTWLYAVIFNNIAHVQKAVDIRRRRRLVLEGVKLRRKSQLESKIFKLIKRRIYIPLITWYLRNLVQTKKYSSWVEKNYLGSADNYNIAESYIYIFLIVINIPFRFFLVWKTLFYRVHINFYLKFNNIFRYKALYNPKSSYMFNWFFFHYIVHLREVAYFTAWDIMERILNFYYIYGTRSFKDTVKAHAKYLHDKNMEAAGSKRKEEYYDYFYYRMFGNYDPEMEFFYLQRARFFTRIWYYGTDYSYDQLTTHQLYLFFNYFDSPLWVRSNSTSLFNFYFMKVSSKLFMYYYYYSFFILSRLKGETYFLVVRNYAFYITFYCARAIVGWYLKLIDGNLSLYLRYFWNVYFSLFFSWLYEKYFVIKYTYICISIICISFAFMLNLTFSIIRSMFIFIGDSLLKFFSPLAYSDLGRSFSFWQKYYMLKFYFVEYNIFIHIFLFIKNFFFNFFLICLIFFILTSLPYVKEIFFSEYLARHIYLFVNNVFEFNKLIYFNEVLDNWWVPHYSPKKFVKYYTAYSNYFELRLKKLYGRIYIDAFHLGKRKYYFNNRFFHFYFERHFRYLKYKKLKWVHDWCRTLIPGSFAWELYFYMHAYFILSNHPAIHFMPNIYYHSLPIVLTFYWRYKYYLFVNSIFVPVYWFWKYSFSYVIFNILIYFNDTMFSSVSVKFCDFLLDAKCRLNYGIFTFCYYYYFYFLFTVSKTMRYYFVTYDFLNYFWVYRSVRFMVIVDFLNFCKICLDSFYFFVVESFYGFFYFFYRIMYFLLSVLGLVSMDSYLLFSMNVLERFHIFIAEWFDHFVTLNYDLDEYGKILSKHFRQRTRYRIGHWTTRNMAVKSVSVFHKHTVNFEFKVRQFLFYMKKDLIKNFLIFNGFKASSFNLFFFSAFSLYLNYFFLLTIFTVFSLRLRKGFKNGEVLSATPFFEWERFTKKNRHLIQRDEFYWLYNMKWLRTFGFYYDKHFSDDLFLYTFRGDITRFGFYLYKQFNKFFIAHEKYVMATADVNNFLLYKRYYVERYIGMVKDIDLIFHEYTVSKRKHQYNIISLYNFFVPFRKKYKMNFKKEFIHSAGHPDLYWFNYATPNLLYTRNWNFTRVIGREKEALDFYAKLKKSLFKAYGLYEMNRETFFLDLFEFQIFDPDFYDDLVFENVRLTKHNKNNYFLHRIALSRWSSELVYRNPGYDIFERFSYLGYRDSIEKLEYYYEYLRILNLKYMNDYVDFSLFNFVPMFHPIETNIDAVTVKNSINLAINDSVLGVKARDLYQYEDLGRVATEQYIFELLDESFLKSSLDPDYNTVVMLDDPGLEHKLVSTWTVLTMFLPIIIVVIFFQEYTYMHKYVFPHIPIRDFFLTFLYRVMSPYDAEIITFHKSLTHEHEILKYWYNPFIWLKTFAFDLHRIDNFSFWEGKHAKFFQSKSEFAWFFSMIVHDSFRYDNISFLIWNFYVKAWRECWEAVVLFVLFDFICYFLFILVWLWISNGYIYLRDLYRYFSKMVFVVLDDQDAEYYRQYDKEMAEKREKRKYSQFDFLNIGYFEKFEDKITKYKKNRKFK